MDLLYGRLPLLKNRIFKIGVSTYRHRARFNSTTAATKPLRILFCGSDEFSVVSLKKLHEESRRDPELIASVDVVCKAGKLSGRGLREIRDVPIKSVAKDLGLPFHEIPTFKSFSPPVRDEAPTNLVIAVSFGLLVPGRILNSLEYGGMNLHPSLLPELQGPAPLQHTIMRGLKNSGITLQTLHPTHFDQGLILAQDYFPLPDDASNDIELLRHLMSQRAAELLVKSLRNRVFIPPIVPTADIVLRSQSYAPKVTPEDSHIVWTKWSSDNILRAQSAIGPLWSNWTYIDSSKKHQSLRIQWHNLKRVTTGCRPAEPGNPAILTNEAHDTTTETGLGKDIGGIWTCDGHFLSPECATIAGRKKGWPGNAGRVVDYLWSLTRTTSKVKSSSNEAPDKPTLC